MFLNIINTIAYFFLDIFRSVEYVLLDITNMLHTEPIIPNDSEGEGEGEGEEEKKTNTYEDWYTEFQNEMILLFEKRPHTHKIHESDDDDDNDIDIDDDSDLDFIEKEELELDLYSGFKYKSESESESESKSESELESESESESELEWESKLELEEYSKIRLVSIEGNIGGGKSTLIQTLQEKYKDRSDILFIQEPIDIWNTIKDNTGKNILQYFYENLGKYAFAFQIMAYTTRLNLIKETIRNASKKVKVIVMERSLEADSNIFAKMLFEEGIMNTIEYQIYNLMGKDNWNEYGVDGIIWLRTEPEECYSRIQHRNREGEEGINIEYLRKCHQYHLEWLSSDMGFVCDIGGSSDPKILELDLEKIDNYLF